MSFDSNIYRHGNLIRYVILGIGGVVVITSLRTVGQLYSSYQGLASELKLTAQSRTPDRKSTKNTFNRIDINKAIFEAIGNAAKQHGVVVKEIGTPLISKKSGYVIMTEEIVLEGDFSSMMHCINSADETLGTIKISSMKFERMESAKADVLLLKVFFQLVNIDDEAS